MTGFGVEPVEDSGERLGGEAAPVGVAGEDPAGFGDVVDRGFDLAFEVGEADVAGEAAGRFLRHRPVAVTEDGPEAAQPEEAEPTVVAAGRRAEYMSHDLRVAPHVGTRAEILVRVAAQDEACGFEDGWLTVLGHGFLGFVRAGPFPPRPMTGDRG